MYNYIIGKVTYAMGNTLVVENNGIGYEIGVSATTLYDCCTPGEIVKIYTYLYVREDTFSLYGFSKLEEKTLFLRLIDISGVGPKLAMELLDGCHRHRGHQNPFKTQRTWQEDGRTHRGQHA